MRNTVQHKSRLMIIASMVIFGTLGPFVRNIPIPSAALALCRAVMAVALLGLYFLISGQRIDFRAIRKELPLLLISGMAIGVNWILLFEAYRYTTVSVATLSYYFAPVLVTIACPLLFHEKMGYRMVGEFKKCGYKFGKWYGIVWMEKHLTRENPPQSVIPFGELKGEEHS